MSAVLDTTVIIDYVNGSDGAREMLERLFAEPGELYTCDIVTCEALSGGGPNERRAVVALLDVLEYVAIDPDGARTAGDMRRADGHASPRTLGDALIAGLAARLDAAVVTRNPADFAAYDVRVIPYGSPAG